MYFFIRYRCTYIHSWNSRATGIKFELKNACVQRASIDHYIKKWDNKIEGVIFLNIDTRVNYWYSNFIELLEAWWKCLSKSISHTVLPSTFNTDVTDRKIIDKLIDYNTYCISLLRTYYTFAPKHWSKCIKILYKTSINDFLCFLI